MSKYIIRLDDACPKMDIDKWSRIETLLDKYSIKPLVGVIPNCEDPEMDKYKEDPLFWKKVRNWMKKEWVIAMHGFNHVYGTNSGGINPVNKRSEFAGLSLEEQSNKIIKGIEILNKEGVKADAFFAPSHTFDINTITAIKESSLIRFISDTIAFSPYKKYDLTFVPQQSGRCRKFLFGTITFCYHPNIMKDNDFVRLEKFLKKHSRKFISFPSTPAKRHLSIFDFLFRFTYFTMRKFR